MDIKDKKNTEALESVDIARLFIDIIRKGHEIYGCIKKIILHFQTL